MKPLCLVVSPRYQWANKCSSVQVAWLSIWVAEAVGGRTSKGAEGAHGLATGFGGTLASAGDAGGSQLHKLTTSQFFSLTWIVSAQMKKSSIMGSEGIMEGETQKQMRSVPSLMQIPPTQRVHMMIARMHRNL